MELTTSAEVRAWLGLEEGRDAEELELSVAAVNALVPTWIDVPTPVPSNIKLGATALAARVYRRKNSPGGIESIGDLGPVYVSRSDPEIAMLLGLGNFRKPKAL